MHLSWHDPLFIVTFVADFWLVNCQGIGHCGAPWVTQSSKKSFRFRSIHFGFVGHLCYADSLAFYKPNVRTVALFSSLLDLGLYCKSLVVSHRAVDSGSGCIVYVNQLLKSICMNSSNNFIEKILCLRPACDAAEVVRRCAFF